MCKGCLRIPREIARWAYADNAEKYAVLQELRARRRALAITSEADRAPVTSPSSSGPAPR